MSTAQLSPDSAAVHAEPGFVPDLALHLSHPSTSSSRAPAGDSPRPFAGASAPTALLQYAAPSLGSTQDSTCSTAAALSTPGAADSRAPVQPHSQQQHESQSQQLRADSTSISSSRSGGSRADSHDDSCISLAASSSGSSSSGSIRGANGSRMQLLPPMAGELAAQQRHAERQACAPGLPVGCVLPMPCACLL